MVYTFRKHIRRIVVGCTLATCIATITACTGNPFTASKFPITIAYQNDLAAGAHMYSSINFESTGALSVTTQTWENEGREFCGSVAILLLDGYNNLLWSSTEQHTCVNGKQTDTHYLTINWTDNAPTPRLAKASSICIAQAEDEQNTIDRIANAIQQETNIPLRLQGLNPYIQPLQD